MKTGTTTMTSMTDLISAILGGDQQAFTVLFQQTSQEVYRTARAILRDEDAALDVQQDTYVFAYNHLDQLQDPEKVLPWLRSIAVNRAKSVLRKQTPLLFTELENEEGEGLPEQADLSPEASPELSLERKETAELVSEILADLSDGQRAAIAMYYYEQMSVDEIAEALGVANGTVKSHLARGKKKIEEAVRALEKKGVKLYGLSPVGFLVALMRRMQPAEAAAQTAVKTIVTKAAADAAVTAAKPVTALTFSQMVKGSIGKILIGALSVAVIGGGIWVGVKLLNREQPTVPKQPTETVKAVLLSNSSVAVTTTDEAEDLTEPAVYVTVAETDPEASEAPIETAKPEETTEPEETTAPEAHTDPTGPTLSEDIEAELTALERNLPEDYFTELTVADCSFFSNAHTRIWDEGGAIAKKDLDSGATERLFSYARESGHKTALVGVTKNRLYFGWDELGETDWFGWAIYSVDYKNQNRVEVSARSVQPEFRDGWLVLKGFRTDVSTTFLSVVDRNDQKLVDVRNCWDGRVVDGSVYYVCCTVQDMELYDYVEQTSSAINDGLISYDVCRLDPSGSNTNLGTISARLSIAFYIDPTSKEIVDDVDDRIDLNTLQSKNDLLEKENLAVDLPSPEDETGVEVKLIKNDSQAIAFWALNVLYVYDGTTRDLLFTADLTKALGCEWATVNMQGDQDVLCVDLSEDRTKLLAYFPVGVNQTPDHFCLIDLQAQTLQRTYHRPAHFEAVPTGFSYDVIGETGTFGSLWILHDGEKWQPFPAQ